MYTETPYSSGSEQIYKILRCDLDSFIRSLNLAYDKGYSNVPSVLLNVYSDNIFKLTGLKFLKYDYSAVYIFKIENPSLFLLAKLKYAIPNYNL